MDIQNNLILANEAQLNKGRLNLGELPLFITAWIYFEQFPLKLSAHHLPLLKGAMKLFCFLSQLNLA